jgi:hypothetical protein
MAGTAWVCRFGTGMSHVVIGAGRMAMRTSNRSVVCTGVTVHVCRVAVPPVVSRRVIVHSHTIYNQNRILQHNQSQNRIPTHLAVSSQLSGLHPAGALRRRRLLGWVAGSVEKVPKPAGRRGWPSRVLWGPSLCCCCGVVQGVGAGRSMLGCLTFALFSQH